MKKNVIKHINELGLRAKIVGWNRAKLEDIYASLDIGLKVVHVSIPISQIQMKYKLKKDCKYVRTHLINILRILNREGIKYSVGGEDSSRADEDMIIEIIKIAKEEGAYKYRYSDTVGVLNPLKTFKNIKKLTSLFKDILIEIHTHNDFGMASANSVAALQAGASSLSGSVSGIGERAGNCALEEVVSYLNFIENEKINFNLIKAKKLAEFIAKITKRPIPLPKPIFGKNIFYHEAGIHTDGILKNPINYEAFPPEYVGAKRKLMIGKHSGSSIVKHELHKIGCQVTNDEAKDILNIIKARSVKLKRCLTHKEVESIYNSYKLNTDYDINI